MLGSLNRNVYENMVIALGSDSTTLLGIELFLHLTKTDFTPGLDTDFSAVLLADFQTYAVRPIAAAGRATNYNVFTGNMEMILPPPTAGLGYDTDGTNNLPQTIYGVVLSDDSTTIGGGHALAYGRLDDPVTLTINLQHFDIPPQRVQVIQAAVNQI